MNFDVSPYLNKAAQSSCLFACLFAYGMYHGEPMGLSAVLTTMYSDTIMLLSIYYVGFVFI